jgi:REP element-mobilizing transposase RayT
MTAPRQILAGTSYLVTRRCSERRLFLRPSALTNEVFQYALAVAAKRYGVLVHVFCVLSNHYHLVVTDTRARLPDFQQYLDFLLAKAMNCALGRWESFWDPDSYSAVRLESDDAIVEKMVYVLANPVAAGLVRYAAEWPGLWSDPSLIDGPPIVARRPTVYFDEDGPMPAEAILRLTRPPAFERDGTLVEELRRGLIEAEDAAAAEFERENRSFLGAVRVRAQKPTSRPAPGEPRRALNPRVACRAKWKRIEALQRLAEFARAYREALALWRGGMRDAVFPPGTWQMRVLHRVPCGAECG